MKSLLQLKQQLQGTQDLQVVVKAMKALAAANIHQYQDAVASLSKYFQTVEMGLQILLQSPMSQTQGITSANFFQAHLLPGVHTEDGQPAQSAGIIVFGSEQGMSGHFNQELVDFVRNQLEQKGIPFDGTRIQPIGSRLPAVLDARLPELSNAERVIAMPHSLDGIAAQVKEVGLRVDAWQAQGGIQSVLLFHQKPHANAGYHPVMVQILPLDGSYLKDLAQKPWPNRQVPAYNIPGLELFSMLVRQFLFATLFQAFTESLASENASRLAAMQMAEKKVDERLGYLRQALNQQRQIQITQEVLDVVTGYEALKSVRSI